MSPAIFKTRISHVQAVHVAESFEAAVDLVGLGAFNIDVFTGHDDQWVLCFEQGNPDAPVYSEAFEGDYVVKVGDQLDVLDEATFITRYEPLVWGGAF